MLLLYTKLVCSAGRICAKSPSSHGWYHCVSLSAACMIWFNELNRLNRQIGDEGGEGCKRHAHAFQAWHAHGQQGTAAEDFSFSV